MERYNSTYKDISMRGTPAELIRKHEGLAFQAERDGDSYMMHIHRNYSDHWKRVK